MLPPIFCCNFLQGNLKAMLCIARTFQQENEEDMFEVFYIQENEEEFSHNLTQLQQQLPGDGKKGRQ